MNSENGQSNSPVKCFVIVISVIAVSWFTCRWCDQTGVIVWYDEPTPHFWFERALKQWIAERFHD